MGRARTKAADSAYAWKLTFDGQGRRGNGKGQVSGIWVDHSDLRKRCLICDADKPEMTMCHECAKDISFWDIGALIAGFAKPVLSMPLRKQWIELEDGKVI